MNSGASLAHFLVGDSEPMRRVRDLIATVAPTTLPVLIRGPSGSGKELVARAIHRMSGRRGQFVATNVCAIPDSMFEAELFGHVKGAFTGAFSDNEGLLESANGGTIFLDEIGPLGMEAQAKLLRAIELREFTPIGQTRSRTSEFRLVSATNQDIESGVREERFREDLLHRLRGVVLWIPPLVERLEDIPAIARRLLDQESPDLARKRFDDAAFATLARHLWPGNVRELRHVVCLAAVLAESIIIGSDAVVAAFALGRTSRGTNVCSTEAGIKETQFVQRLLRALEASGGDTAAVAHSFGVSRYTVYRWLHAHGMQTPKRKRVSSPRPERSEPHP